MSDEEIKNRLNSIIDDCEEIAQWIGEVYAAMGEDMYQSLDSMLNRMYDEAVNMSRIAVNTRLVIAENHGKSGNKKDKEAE